MRKQVAFFVVVALLCTLLGTTALADNPFAGMKTYSEGQYWVGHDMTPGEYVLISTSNYSGYFAITMDANGNDIFANDLFEVNSIVTVKSGEFLELSRCIAVLATDFYGEYSIKSSNPGTMLKVGYGYDLYPGTYKLKCTSSEYSGYYAIYNDSRHDDIVSNDLFKGSSYITVTSGQYVILSRCVIDN